MTAIREYATCVVATATPTAPTRAGEAAVARSPEPPGRGDARNADEDRNDSGGAVRGLVEAELGRREDEEQEARVVVPAGVEPAAVDELPCAGDEVLLVRVEERQR